MVDWIYEVEKKYPALEIKDFERKLNKKIDHDRFRGLRVFGVTILIISVVALLIIGIDHYFVSIFPENSRPLSFFTSFS